MKHSSKTLHTVIFAVCYIAYTAIYMARLNLSMASDVLTGQAGRITTGEYGILGGAFLVVYALGRLLNGDLSDRISPHIMLGAGLLFAGLANIGFSFLPPFWGMLILWCANAWAQSMLWSSVLRVVAAMYDEAKAKRMTSFMVTSVATGNIIGIIASSAIIIHFGLAWAFILPGAFTILMGAVCFVLIGRLDVGRAEKAAHAETAAPLTELIRHPDLRMTIPCAFLHGMMKDNITGWMTKYFIFMYAIDLAEASSFALFIPIVGFVGRMIYPPIYRMVGEGEHKVSLIGFVICLAASIPLCLGTRLPVIAMIFLGLIYAAVSLINTTLLSIYPIRFVKQHRVATVSGIMDFATYLGAGLSSMVYGFVITHAGYVPMYVSWAVVSAISILLSVMLIRREKITD
ncbi:MAG: MFS transporter [Ruminococcaceae bacterium]|nr:MFS transporter [Oscillospiraceae bacterium]